MPAADSPISRLAGLLGAGKSETLLRFAVTLLLLLLVARTGAELTWQFGAPLVGKSGLARPGRPGQLPQAVTPAANKPAPVPAEEIALFGQAAGSLAAADRSGLEVAPATSLNLLLKGVVAVRPMRRALAVVAERNGGSDQLYGQGETLPGNAVIREIHPDRIVISRGGVLETLFLEGLREPAPDQPAASAGPAPARSGEYIQPRGDGINWRVDQDYWEERLADVPGLAREVGVEIYAENNQQKGYRLVSVQNSKLLADLGLQPGDILLSVNGRAMNNVQEGLAAYQQVKKGGQVNIEISRNGRRETRVYNVGG